METMKSQVQVRQYREDGSFYVIETIHRKLWAEQCGNFNPIFCRWRGKRCLVESDQGDLGDPFRRNDSYASSLFIQPRDEQGKRIFVKAGELPEFETQVKPMRSEWYRLLRALKSDICDECRASDDPNDTTPGMQVTIGFTPATEDREASWSYQTGDNSYTGGAYGHPHWAVISLYRRSNCRELVEEIVNELADALVAHCL